MAQNNSQPATKKDLKQTEQVLRAEIELSAKETKEEMKEEMRQNTDKVLNTFDKYLKEVIASREERVIVAGKISEHKVRIEKLENQVFPA